MFLSTPRYFGFPSQMYVRTTRGLLNLIQTVNGQAPCFVSVLQYPQKHQPVFDKFVFDLDSDHLSDALEDVRKLRSYAKKLRAKYSIVFSGRKGFHFYIHCMPSLVTSHLLGEVHEFIANHLNLQTADPHIFGDLRRVIRLPTSRYVSSDGIVNGHYCRAISDHDVDKGIAHILNVSKHPGLLPEAPTVDYSLTELMHRMHGFTVRRAKLSDKPRLQFSQRADSSAVTSLNAIVPECLRRHITDYNPIHAIRFETACWLKLCSYSNVAIYDFFESLDWRDWDRSRTRYQVRRAKARPPWCKKLKDAYGSDYCSTCSIGEKSVIHRR